MKNSNFFKMLFIAVIGIVISFSACKKEETTKDEKTKYYHYLTKESHFTDNKTIPDTYTEYLYDNENKLIKKIEYGILSTDEYIFEYDPDNKIVYLKRGTDFYEKYEYNSKNQINRIIGYNNSWETLIYNGDGSIIKSEHYNMDGQLNYYSTFEYDKNGNTTKNYGYHANGTKYFEQTMTYYNFKINPLSDIYQYQTLKRILFEHEPNIKTYNDIGYNLDGSIKYNYSKSYTYEYINGYTTKKIDDIGDFTNYEYRIVIK